MIINVKTKQKTVYFEGECHILKEKKEQKMNKQDDQIPYGFGMALASRPDALLAFLSMPSL